MNWYKIWYFIKLNIKVFTDFLYCIDLFIYHELLVELRYIHKKFSSFKLQSFNKQYHHTVGIQKVLLQIKNISDNPHNFMAIIMQWNSIIWKCNIETLFYHHMNNSISSFNIEINLSKRWAIWKRNIDFISSWNIKNWRHTTFRQDSFRLFSVFSIWWDRKWEESERSPAHFPWTHDVI